MPKMVVYELFEVTVPASASTEDVIAKAKAISKRSKSMYVVAPALDQLAHPIHLQEAHDKFLTTVPLEETEPAPIPNDYGESAE